MDFEYCAHGDRRVNPGKKVRGILLTGIYPTIVCGAWRRVTVLLTNCNQYSSSAMKCQYFYVVDYALYILQQIEMKKRFFIMVIF
jgi:hypothetical protein